MAFATDRHEPVSRQLSKNRHAGNRPLRCESRHVREFPPTMRWYERIAAALDARKVSRAEVGRNMDPPMSGQAITLKLQGKRPTNVDELEVMSRLAGMSVAEVLGDDAVVIELRDEMDVVKLYRLMTPEQRKRWVGLGMDVVGINELPAEEPQPH